MKSKGIEMGKKNGQAKAPFNAFTLGAPADDEYIFQVTGIDLEIPRGELVAIVGAVGMGKTSLLQVLIVGMRRTFGTVEFGGSVGYCAQTAWIQVGLLISLSASVTERQAE
jgi:ABC-type polysaccharide/polyol phosphate transport system ATPase subunit